MIGATSDMRTGGTRVGAEQSLQMDEATYLNVGFKRDTPDFTGRAQCAVMRTRGSRHCAHRAPGRAEGRASARH
jgi:hypothetical protein